MKPRNDFVLVRIVPRTKLATPDGSTSAHDFVVEDYGPKVEGLSVGDYVIPAVDAPMYGVPHDDKLAVIREECLLLVGDRPPNKSTRVIH